MKPDNMHMSTIDTCSLLTTTSIFTLATNLSSENSEPTRLQTILKYKKDGMSNQTNMDQSKSKQNFKGTYTGRNQIGLPITKNIVNYQLRDMQLETVCFRESFKGGGLSITPWLKWPIQTIQQEGDPLDWSRA